MDYNARNRPYLSKYPVFKPKPVTSTSNRSLQITNDMSACDQSEIGNVFNLTVCGIDTDYVLGKPALKVQVINTTNKIVERVYYIQPGTPGVISLAENEYAAISTQFSDELCWHQNADGSHCPTSPLHITNYLWNIFYQQLVSTAIINFIVSGSQCCFSTGTTTFVGYCVSGECARLYPDPITGTFLYPNNQRKEVVSQKISVG